jgi:hypothetical protein
LEVSDYRLQLQLEKYLAQDCLYQRHIHKSNANAIAWLEHDPSDDWTAESFFIIESQIRIQNAVKNKTGNSFKTIGQTINKYQHAWRFKSHVCESRKEDGLYRLTTIEIAKVQKKDYLIYSKKMQKHHNWIGVFNLLKTE